MGVICFTVFKIVRKEGLDDSLFLCIFVLKGNQFISIVMRMKIVFFLIIFL